MCWWAFTGLTHVILEGYFVFSPEFYKDKTAHYLAGVCKYFFFFFYSYTLYFHLWHLALFTIERPFQPFILETEYGIVKLWKIMVLIIYLAGKEYSKGDSRYAARDAATVTVEGVTAVFEGPASLLAVYDFT
jgi:cholestenol delta-isomerase